LDAQGATGIESIPDPVAENVEGQRGEEQRPAGEYQVPPRSVQEDAGCAADHLAPVSGRRYHADAQEGDGGLAHDRPRNQQGAVDDQRREEVRQDVDEHDPPWSGPQGPGRLDVLSLPDREHLAADETADRGPAEESEHNDDDRQAGLDSEPAPADRVDLDYREERDREEQERNREQPVHEPRQDAVDDLPEIA